VASANLPARAAIVMHLGDDDALALVLGDILCQPM
jgi:hypothetical protein